MKQNCVEHVEFRQPIPPEVLKNATEPLPAEWFNETEEATSNNETEVAPTNNVPEEATTTTEQLSTETKQVTITLKSTVFTPELLQSLKEIACPFECNGNGECTNGKRIVITFYHRDHDTLVKLHFMFVVYSISTDCYFCLVLTV